MPRAAKPWRKTMDESSVTGFFDMSKYEWKNHNPFMETKPPTKYDFVTWDDSSKYGES